MNFSLAARRIPHPAGGRPDFRRRLCELLHAGPAHPETSRRACDRVRRHQSDRQQGSPPFDAWSVKNGPRTDPDAWRPLTWVELENARSGLVQVGGHSHRHLKGAFVLTGPTGRRSRAVQGDPRRATWGRSGLLLSLRASRLGFVPAAYVRAVEAAGYRLALTTDLGRVSTNSDPYLLPRVEAHGLDGPAVIRAKGAGQSRPYRLADRLRRAERAA